MKGFSLIEIMVTVAIMSIMASSVVVGFNSFGQTVRLQETTGVITDTLKNLELEMIRREYKKQTVNFEPEYLVVEAEVEGQVDDQIFSLSWIKPSGCTGGKAELEIDNSVNPSPVYLAQRDKYGNNIEITVISANDTGTDCVDFNNYEETESQYQVFQGAGVSQIIRFIHFNIRRGDSDDAPTVAMNDYTLEISAPYASKEIFENDGPPTLPAILTVEQDVRQETITLQQ